MNAEPFVYHIHEQCINKNAIFVLKAECLLSIEIIYRLTTLIFLIIV